MRPTASFTIVFASLAFAAPHKAEQLSSIESLPDSVEVHAVRGAPVKAPLLPSTSTAPPVTTALAATTSTKTTSESTTSASSSSSGAPSPPAESSPADPVDTLWPTDSSSSEDVSHIDIWSNSSDHAGDLGNEVSTPDTDDLNRWKNRCGENYYRCQDGCPKDHRWANCCKTALTVGVIGLDCFCKFQQPVEIYDESGRVAEGIRQL